MRSDGQMNAGIRCEIAAALPLVTASPAIGRTLGKMFVCVCGARANVRNALAEVHLGVERLLLQIRQEQRQSIEVLDQFVRGFS